MNEGNDVCDPAKYRKPLFDSFLPSAAFFMVELPPCGMRRSPLSIKSC